MCIAAAIAGAGVVGAVGSGIAAHQQAGAAERAQNIAQNQYQQTAGLERPFVQGGYGALSNLNYLEGIGSKSRPAGVGNATYGQLNQPFTAANWQQLSPMYNFVRGQGQQGVLNASAGGQGSLSGAALKDLTGYNQSLAQTSFGNAYNIYQSQNQAIYDRLSNIANLGQSAASGTAQAGVNLAGQAGQAAQNYGTAVGGGIAGAANNLSGGAQSAIPWLMAGNMATNAATQQGSYLSQLYGPSSANMADAFQGLS